MSLLRLSYDHPLSGDEARERLSVLGDYLGSSHGIAVSWTSTDAATVRGVYLTISVEAIVLLQPGAVVFEARDPGEQWRDRVREYFRGKLARYLDPSTPLDALPRE